MDLVTGLPKSEGLDRNKYNVIATYIDLHFKAAHFVLTTEQVDTEEIVNIHEQEIFRLHGLPRGIISDRGPQFAARVMRELYDKLGIKHGLTTAYHPQSNGRVERKNQEVEKYLRNSKVRLTVLLCFYGPESPHCYW